MDVSTPCLSVTSLKVLLAVNHVDRAGDHRLSNNVTGNDFQNVFHLLTVALDVKIVAMLQA